jgi:hypothetical protein
MRAVVLLLLLMPSLASGQAASYVRPPFTLKTAPANLINPFQLSVDLLADIPLVKRFGLEMGLAYVFDSDPYTTYKNETYTGFKVKPTLKYYLEGNEKRNLYLALAFKYANIHNNKYLNVYHQGDQYVETTLLTNDIEIWGWALRGGVQKYLGARKRFIFESSVAFGRRYLDVSRTPLLPPDTVTTEVTQTLFSLREPGFHKAADFMLCLHLGWIISR